MCLIIECIVARILYKIILGRQILGFHVTLWFPFCDLCFFIRSIVLHPKNGQKNMLYFLLNSGFDLPIHSKVIFVGYVPNYRWLGVHFTLHRWASWCNSIKTLICRIFISYYFPRFSFLPHGCAHHFLSRWGQTVAKTVIWIHSRSDLSYRVAISGTGYNNYQ